jgi:murein DD-endopeptidase MepM/ murein hydrolase activator NlpD
VTIPRASALSVALAISSGLILPDAASQIAVTARARSIRPGELVVLTMVPPAGAQVLHVRVFDRDLPAFKADGKTWQVLVGIDLATAPGTYDVTISADNSDAARTTYPLVVKPRTFPTRTLTVDEAFVNPPPEALKQIEQDTRVMNRVWASGAAVKLWTGAFVLPVPDPANSRFGTRSVLNGQPRSPHSGADFLSPEGRPVKAPNAGHVVFAGSQYFTGNTIVIDHGLGLFSLFAHLSHMVANVGDDVLTGAVIGEVGATGRVTGPHLHWTVRLNGARVDPLSLIALLGERPVAADR